MDASRFRLPAALLLGAMLPLACTTVANAAISAVHCPAGALTPGASMTCTATYTVTQADIDSGAVTDVATAAATPPSGPAVMSAPSSATVTAKADPAVSLVKSVSPGTVTSAGQTVISTFVVTNTGNVTLSGVGVNDTIGNPTAIKHCDPAPATRTDGSDDSFLSGLD